MQTWFLSRNSIEAFTTDTNSKEEMQSLLDSVTSGWPHVIQVATCDYAVI